MAQEHDHALIAEARCGRSVHLDLLERTKQCDSADRGIDLLCLLLLLIGFHIEIKETDLP